MVVILISGKLGLMVKILGRRRGRLGLELGCIPKLFYVACFEEFQMKVDNVIGTDLLVFVGMEDQSIKG